MELNEQGIGFWDERTLKILVAMYNETMKLILHRYMSRDIPYTGNHPRKNKFTDFAKFGSFANVFLLLFSVY